MAIPNIFEQTKEPGALDTLLAQMQKAQETATTANLKREEEIRAITDAIIARYQPGGAFQEAGLAHIAKAKTQAVGGGMQSLIASGLAGTETAAGLGTGFEAGAGSQMRLSLEDLMMERLSSAQMSKAGFIEGIQDEYPDTSLMAQLAMQAAESPGHTYSRTIDWGGSSSGASPGGGATYSPTAPSTAYTASPSTASTGTGSAYGESLASRTGTATGIKMGTPIIGDPGSAKSTSMTVWKANGESKVIHVPQKALGAGPGGFRDEATYLSYVPSGYSTRKPG